MTLPDAYMVAIGHDALEGDMELIDPEPRNDNDVQYPDFVYGSDKSVQPVGEPFIDLLFEGITHEEYNGLLTLFGLTTDFSSEITIHIHEDDDTYNTYNATVVKPNGKQRALPGWLDVVFRVTLDLA